MDTFLSSLEAEASQQKAKRLSDIWHSKIITPEENVKFGEYFDKANVNGTGFIASKLTKLILCLF